MTTVGDPLLIDTDVLVDYLRERNEAVNYIDSQSAPLFLSVITVAELYAGVRDGKERAQLDSFIGAFGVIPLDHAIAVTGGLYRRDYGKSHGTGLADALIAATAITHQLILVTLNKRHFPMVKNLVVPHGCDSCTSSPLLVDCFDFARRASERHGTHGIRGHGGG